MTDSQAPRSSFQVLRGLAAKPEITERCELCREPLGVRHEHLLEPRSRKLLCSCVACAILFSSAGADKYRRVPRDVRALKDFSISDAQWEGLSIPIGLAFFVKGETEGKVSAMYPSPAGPVESLLPLDAWQEIAAQSPLIAEMAPHVEAVLVNRAGNEYYLAPIDECYRLVGLIRANWRGFSGGSEVWSEIRSFFEGLRGRALPEARHA